MDTESREKRVVFADSVQIDKAVMAIANQINEEYKEKSPLLIGILKGSFVFLADLARKLDMAVEIDFIGLSSYHEQKKSTGKISLYCEPSAIIRGRDVILVEDLVDTGLSTSFAVDYVKNEGANSVKLCALLDKKSCRVVDVAVDYFGFDLPDRFVVGYGMDYNEKYRHLKDIIILGDE